MMDHDEHKQTPRFQTNIPAENSEFIRQAAEKTGFNIEMHRNAHDNRQRTMSGYISVWTNEPLARDHGPFWREYRRLVDAAKLER